MQDSISNLANNMDEGIKKMGHGHVASLKEGFSGMSCVVSSSSHWPGSDHVA
jgi:hypothetical protein